MKKSGIFLMIAGIIYILFSMYKFYLLISVSSELSQFGLGGPGAGSWMYAFFDLAASIMILLSGIFLMNDSKGN